MFWGSKKGIYWLWEWCSSTEYFPLTVIWNKKNYALLIWFYEWQLLKHILKSKTITYHFTILRQWLLIYCIWPKIQKHYFVFCFYFFTFCVLEGFQVYQVFIFQSQHNISSHSYTIIFLCLFTVYVYLLSLFTAFY